LEPLDGVAIRARLGDRRHHAGRDDAADLSRLLGIARPRAGGSLAPQHCPAGPALVLDWPSRSRRTSMPALRNQWYCAALSHEIKEAPLGLIFLGEPVVMYRKSDGTAVALEDRCCHRRAPLSRGQVEGDNLRCGYHGLLYAPGGKVIWEPGQEKLPPGAQVRSYPFVEKHGWA